MPVQIPDHSGTWPYPLRGFRQFKEMDTGLLQALTHLCASACATEFSSVNLIDEDRQWRLASTPSALAPTGTQAFCSHTISTGELLMVPDARNDARFAQDETVTSPSGIRFYAGIPLTTQAGIVLGTLNLTHSQPHILSDAQQEQFKAIARTVSAALETYAGAASGTPNDADSRAPVDAAPGITAAHSGQQPGRHYATQSVDLLEAVSDAFIALDREWRYTYVNENACRILDSERDALIGRRIWDVVPALVDLPFYEACHRAMRENVYAELEGHYPQYGTWLEHRIHPTREGLTILFTDITARKEAEQVLLLREKALHTTSDGIVIVDAVAPDMPVIYVNAAYGRLTGYAPHEVLGRNCRFLQGKLHDQEGLATIRSAVHEQTEGQAVLRNFRKDGTMFWNELKVAPVRDHEGSVTHFIGSQTDVSERIHYQDELARQANYDALTGLPNRKLLEQHLEQMIHQARRSGHLVGVAFIDLDHFKSINDTIGHGVGDLLLKATAERFKANLRACDMVARLGGDEFVVVCPDIHLLSDMDDVIARIFTSLRAPLTIGEHDFRVDASIGVSGYPADATSVSDLLKCADMAMYTAKAAGRGNLKFYKAEIGMRVSQRLSIEQELRQAIVNNEFVLHYQPKVDAHTGVLSGMEALIRWNHPKQGLVAPAQFIQIAEESKLIIPIGDWVLREACRQNQEWVDAGLSNFPISVNVSVSQLKHLDFSETVIRSLAASGMEAALLDLEITESLAMEGPELFIAMLERIKHLGVSISIDDFGTGYSSLSYIKRFPIDVLKIDRSFVRDISSDADDAAICRTIINMAHNLNLRVVAEGVETVAQAQYLQQHACDELQGYLLCRPETAASMQRRLETQLNWLPD